jgi:hypothetical protein
MATLTKTKRPSATEEKPKKRNELTVLGAEVAKPITTAAPKRISKLRTKGMRSIIGDSAEEIQQLLEVGKNDSATTLIQKRLLQSLIDVLPYAEHNVRATKGQRGVYQLNSLMTSLREVLIDLQATKDKGALGDTLVERIVRPTFLDIGMSLVQESERTNNDIKGLVSPEVYKEVRRTHKESLDRMAEVIKRKYDDAKTQTIAFLQQ